jgi:GH15 family glucan-1,4-alpha-glucosidase
LVLGNGSLLIGIDEHYAIRDLFYPHVGLHNHLSGHMIRTGVWANGRFCWLNADGWTRMMSYEPGTLVAKTTLTHACLGLRLTAQEAVHPQSPAYVRRMEVQNCTDGPLEVRIFFTHDLRIAASDIGDTAFYHPYADAVIHYKGPHYLLFGGSTREGGLYEYATGIKGFGGLEGTWRDAEDGQLSRNPIAQGSVDSTFSIRMTVEAGATGEAFYWIVCGRRLEDVVFSFQALQEQGYAQTLDETARFWSAWSQRATSGLEALPKECQELVRQSLLIMRTQIDNGGAVIAANDTDIMKTNRATYSYMWPRDGALVSGVMDRMGFQQLGRRFFQFCRAVLPADRPILMHKYGPDGSLGASWHPWIVEGQPEVPFQEDETALTVSALWGHYQRHQDLEFLSEMYDGFVVPTCDFMMRHRDPATGLPLPSWDLWEERRGVHTFTVCALVAAMRAAAQIARSLGDAREGRYQSAAEELTAALTDHLFDQDRGVFLRSLRPLRGAKLEPDRTADASILAVSLQRVLPPDDPRVAATVGWIEDTLSVRSKIGGVARYEGDYYFRRSDRHPGNPWIICTLWLAQTKLLAAKSQDDLHEPLRWLRWTHARAAATGVLGEQYHPDTGEPLSVSPLTWSHAEYVLTALEYAGAARRVG